MCVQFSPMVQPQMRVIMATIDERPSLLPTAENDIPLGVGPKVKRSLSLSPSLDANTY